jgi:tetratricopeptide (TPR) repeat protein
MKTAIRYIIILSVLFNAFFPMLLNGEESDKDMFDKARLLFLDGKYDQALDQLDNLIEIFPNSSFYPQFLFYKGKCYEKKNMPQRALDNFKQYLVVSQNDLLKEDAESLIIDMDLMLYEKTGKKKPLEEIVRYLKSRNEFVQYYAAFILSRVKDKTFALKAVSVLSRIIEEEHDPELKNRAKLALLRIDPTLLKQSFAPKEKHKHKNLNDLVLVIQVVNKKSKNESFLLKIPFALATLAIDSLPKDAKKELEEKGYKLNDIIKTVVDKGDILKIESDESFFKIWIE